MRTILKIIAAPFILALILAVAVLSFLSCVAGAVCVVACVGLSLLAILCLLAGQTTGCIAMFVLAFLVSPFGLPALGGWLVERLYGVKYAAMDFMASLYLLLDTLSRSSGRRLEQTAVCFFCWERRCGYRYNLHPALQDSGWENGHPDDG